MGVEKSFLQRKFMAMLPREGILLLDSKRLRITKDTPQAFSCGVLCSNKDQRLRRLGVLGPYPGSLSTIRRERGRGSGSSSRGGRRFGYCLRAKNSSSSGA